MLRVVCAVLCLVCCHAALDQELEMKTTAQTLKNSDGVGIRYYNYISDYSNYPYVASLYDPNSQKMYGNGVVMSKNWVLFRAREAKEIESLLFQVAIYVAVPDTRSLTPASTKYIIKEIKVHPSYTAGDITHDVAMLSVCPAEIIIPTYATIPAAGITYPPASFVDMLIYETGILRQGDIRVEEDAFCVSGGVVGYDAAAHYCAFSHNNIWCPNDFFLDYSPFIILNNEFIGFLVSTPNFSGKYAVQRTETLRAWILAQIVP